MKDDMDNRDLYSGMIRLHILHHAEHEAIFGAGMAEELARHGYKISPGTLYPILHGLGKTRLSEVGGRAVRQNCPTPLQDHGFWSPCAQNSKAPDSRAFWRAD